MALATTTKVAIAAILIVAVDVLILSKFGGGSYSHRTPTAVLGSTEYDMTPAEAPILSGTLLNVFAHILTKTNFGFMLTRMLAQDNKVTQLRELANQIPVHDVNLAIPLHFPLHRLSKAQRKNVEAPADQTITLDDIIKPRTGDTSIPYFDETSDSKVLKLHRSFVSGTSTPSSRLKWTFNRIDALEKTYKMFSTWPVSEDAMKSMEEAAAASTKRYTEGRPLSIWDGVPVAIKDMVNITGFVNSHGSAYHTSQHTAATNDGVVVARFRDLGAIVLPPTSMTEGGTNPAGYNVNKDGPFNPYNASHYSGGSSGGSAVIVGLGVVPVALGWDGGGSIRNPAAFSGIVGLAPGFGRIPLSEGLSMTMLKCGPLATTIDDAALAYAVIARDDKRADYYNELYDGNVLGTPTAHLSALLQPPLNADQPLAGVTIGIYREWFNDADVAVVAACDATVEALVKLGATTKEIVIPNIGALRSAHSMKILSEFAILWDGIYNDVEKDLMLPDTRILVALGGALTTNEMYSADLLRRVAFHHVNAIFDSGVDVIVSPTLPLTSPKVEDYVRDIGESNSHLSVQILRYVFYANLVGLPAISVPVGFANTPEMPVGFMVTGAHWKEDVVLKIAKYSIKPMRPPSDFERFEFE